LRLLQQSSCMEEFPHAQQEQLVILFQAQFREARQGNHHKKQLE